VVLLDSMHPRQANAFAGRDPLLAVVPAPARTGLAELCFDPTDGTPAEQARQFVRDVAEMPAELDRAAKLTRPPRPALGRRHRRTGYAQGWPRQQDDLAMLSSNSVHRTVAGSTHASLVDDENDAAQSSRAIRDVVTAVRTEHG
jgi:hypothetical protein